jgi:hypothetical protein
MFKSNRKTICILIFIVLSSLSSFSQKKTDNLYIEANGKYGFLMGHHTFFSYFYEKHPYAYDIKISKQLTGEKNWHSLYRYPRLGGGYGFCNIGSEYFGSAHSIFGFINIPISKSKINSFNYTISFGYAYVTEHFDTDDNHYNLAIGSAGNVYFNLALDYKLRIAKNLQIKTGLSLTHFSNGAYAKPNTGINVVTADAGLLYNFDVTEYKKAKKEEHKAFNEYSVIASGGVRETSTHTPQKFVITTLSINAERMFWRKRKMGLGIDLFYDTSLKYRLEADTSIQYSNIVNLRPGIHYSHDIVFGKTSITMQVGYYLYTEFKVDGNIYSRFGLRHKLSKHFIASVSLKTHYFKADFIEWGIGYAL